MKKLLSVILSIVVIFCIIPLGEISVGAAASENGYTYYAFSGKSYIAYADKTVTGDVVIPEKLGGYDVAGIYAQSFMLAAILIR